MPPVSKPILVAIDQLLTWQGSCTIAQIAKIAEKKQSEVLRVVNSNAKLLIKGEKKSAGKIVGFNNTAVYENPDEKWYCFAEINYGADKEIQVSHRKYCEDLYTTYYCGGLGDSYAITIILFNSTNLEEVRKRGFIGVKERKIIPLINRWVE